MPSARKLSLAALLLIPAILQAQAPLGDADLILTNGEIFAAGGWAEAVAVKDGVIVAVGDASAVQAYRGAATEVVDLDGATVLPGLHDMHVHPQGGGAAGRQCQFAQGSSLEAVQRRIAECVAERAPGDWIAGGQWDAASIGASPHRSMLDAVAPDNPVVLTDISGHSAWASTLALELSGVDAQTPNPPGGVIERDARGEATGVLRESAAGLVRARVPPPSPDETLEALAGALDLMLSHGITSFTDAVVSEGSMRAYAALADQGRLKQRVRGCIMWRPAGPGANAPADGPLERANLYARDRFSPDCVKLLLDGVPTDGHTAAMVEPYADASLDDAERARGILMIAQPALDAALIELDARGFTVKMHAAGDAAVRAGLDAIAAARRANGYSGLLHDVAHNSFVQPDDIARARGLGATFEMSPYIWYPNPIIPDIAKAIGPERMERWIPVKDALDAGALVVPGSDWPVVPEVNPWIGIETLVTRRAPGGAGERLGAPITLEQAIEMYTVNAARQMGNARRTGRIAPGLLADLIVVDRNPFAIPITDVHRTEVVLALIEGEVVFRRDR